MAPFLCQFPFLVILKVQTARLTEKRLTIKMFSDLALKKVANKEGAGFPKFLNSNTSTFFKITMYIHDTHIIKSKCILGRGRER